MQDESNEWEQDEVEDSANPDDIPLAVMTVPLSEVNLAPKLRLEVIEGLNKGQEWNINACGLVEEG